MKYGLFSENVAAFVALLAASAPVLTIHAFAQMKLAFPILFSFHTNGIPYSSMLVFLALTVPSSISRSLISN